MHRVEERRVDALITSQLWVDAATPVTEVVMVFEQAPDIDSIAVLGHGSVSIVVRSRLYLLLGRRFGFALFAKRPVADLAESPYIVEDSADPVGVITTALTREDSRIYDDIIVAAHGRYVGTVSMRSLLAHHKDLLVESMTTLEELRTRNRELEEVTRAQAESLERAQRMEAVGRLAGGIAHDFNNFLSVILGYGELAISTLTPAHPARPRIDQMVKAGERAAGLVRQLLAFSRRQVLQPRVLSLNAVVSGVEQMLSRLIREDVQLKIALAPDLGNVRADSGQIEQVLMNLVVNARDAMPTGGRLTVETANAELESPLDHPEARPGRYVLLAVTDTGVGMDAKTRGHVFEPFFTTKEAGKGTGLGLATAYGIVNQSGGHIDLSSEPGRGTTFKIFLPRVDEMPEPVASLPGGVLARGAGTILLVEDEPALRRLARELLEGQGYRVLDAASGDHAIEIARRHAGSIDLLLTDVVMPGMNGRQLAETLSLSHPDTSVLYMSGYTGDAVVLAGVLGAGMPFLQKPFSPTTLGNKVRSVLDHSAFFPA